MLYVVLSVRDAATGGYSVPHFAVSQGSGVRAFGDEVNRRDENNMLNKHPKDFDLYKLGVYDDATGMFTCDEPVKIANGSDFREVLQ